MKKKLLVLLTVVTCLTTSIPVIAAEETAGVTETQDVSQTDVGNSGTTRECQVKFSKAGSYSVIIPKTIVLQKKTDNEYTVKVKGDIPSTDSVYVIPTTTVKMHDAKGKSDISCDVSFGTPPTGDGSVEFVYNTINAEDASNVVIGSTHTDKIDGSNLTAGQWTGKLVFSIECSAKGANDTKVAARTAGTCSTCDTPAGP